MERSKKYMRKIFLYSIGLISIWVLLAQCLLMRNRWSDKKAYRVFKTKKVPLEIKDTIINTHHLHYAVCGSDTLPTIVFVHGSPGSWMNYMKYMWDSSMRKKFRIVAIDRPGFGYSDFGKAMHLQEQSNMILPILEKLKMNKPMFLVGHSMGGPISVKMAAAKPTLFKTIVIVAGALDISQEKNETWRKIMNTRPFYWALPGAFGPSNTELLYLKKDLLLLQNDFAKITCNVLFVHGDKDTWVPIENIAYGKKTMINAASIYADTLRGADHQIPWKNKQAFTDILMGLN
jgi:pimeloyl-ACP methyl ester carboxylesterase